MLHNRTVQGDGSPKAILNNCEHLAVRRRTLRFQLMMMLRVTKFVTIKKIVKHSDFLFPREKAIFHLLFHNLQVLKQL